MKRVNQFERTDRDITNALLSLMERKSIEKISVQEILDEAMVNRSTFYQHFTDKYAILERLQEKYITGMTKKIEESISSEVMKLDRVSVAMWEYLSTHREGMRKLLAVRSESLDLEGQMRGLFAGYIRRSASFLDEVEADILAGVMVRFLTQFLKTDMDAHALPEAMLNAWLHMSAYFFRVDDVPGSCDRLLAVVGEMHKQKA